MPRVVQVTPELLRIRSLPRRTWADSAESLAESLTHVLSRGSQALRGIQAAALHDLWLNKGLFGPIRVGGGKTLISLLAPLVLGARRPMLLLPAKLIDKTRREMITLSKHWKIPNYIRIESYEMLGRVQAVDMLDAFRPDLIVGDEIHWLKNRKAARTKRVGRFMHEHPDTRFVALSGTITKRSLKDYAHILSWCLGTHGTPLPTSWGELEDWADALDEHDRDRPDLGALLTLCDREEVRTVGELTAARRAFQRRLTETPGVVASANDGRVAASIRIAPVMIDAKTDDAFDTLRSLWETPDGWPLIDAMAVWRHARELALGFFYRWDPRPPDWWLDPRKTWAKTCRAILADNHRRLDSELAVVQAIDQGFYPAAREALDAWRVVKERFTPNSVAVWLDRSTLDVAAEWADDGGIVWTEHVEWAKELAKHAQMAYYGRHGQDEQRRMIEDHDPRKPLIASIASNGEGRNLQAYARNLIVSPPPGGAQWEQLMGRTHRDGQLADEVSFDVFVGCAEHLRGFWGAVSDARYVAESTGHEQKLLLADITVPERVDLTGPKWA